MKNSISIYLCFLTTVSVSFATFAGLPAATTQTPASANAPATSNPFGSGLGEGSGFPVPGASLGAAQPTATQASGRSDTGNMLFWIFTGSSDSLSKQIQSGFRSRSSMNFGKRLWSVLGGALFGLAMRPVEAQVARIESAIEAKTSGIAASIATKGAQACYDCITNQSTNPYAQNPYSMAPILNPNPAQSGPGIVVH